MAATRLQAVRRQLDYSAAEVILMLRRRADMLGLPLMSAASLKTKLSRWENGHEAVSLPMYRRLFREIYGRTNDELGFPLEQEDDEADELRSRLAVARTVDAETVGIFRGQVENARHVDRQFGGITLLDQLRATITQIEALLRASTTHGQRQSLAGVLAEASALAGWEALDRAATVQAWDHHERAKIAAREADSPILLAHATAQQAMVLIDIEETATAVDLLSHARDLAERIAPPLLRAWLAAAHGEGLAAAGHRDDALRAFDRAEALRPADPMDAALPFVFLADVHLDRWRGAAMAQLGEPEAIDRITASLPRLPADFVRARTRMLVDLAFAHAAAGDRDAALTYARQAKRLAAQIKSDRQRQRLDRLILPGTPGIP